MRVYNPAECMLRTTAHAPSSTNHTHAFFRTLSRENKNILRLGAPRNSRHNVCEDVRTQLQQVYQFYVSDWFVESLFLILYTAEFVNYLLLTQRIKLNSHSCSQFALAQTATIWRDVRATCMRKTISTYSAMSYWKSSESESAHESSSD